MKAFRYLCRAATLVVGCLSLAACGTTGSSLLTPTYPVRATAEAAPKAAQRQAQAGASGTNRPYQVDGKWYTPAEQPNYDQVGLASWYGDAYQGKPTSSGEIFDMNQLSAAHKTLPLPSMVEVTNLDNGRKMVVRVNDRGPFVDGRIIDLSRAAADQLGVLKPGLAHVRVRYVGPAPATPVVELASADPAPPAREYQRPIKAAPAVQSPPPQTTHDEARPSPVPTPPPPVTAPEKPQFASYSVEADKTPVVAAALPVASASWAVRAGSYPDLQAAEQAARRLTTAGAPSIRLARESGQTVYQVVIGAPDQAAAGEVQRLVTARGFPGAEVVQP